MKKFTIFTTGWEPEFTQYLLAPISTRTGIEFIHGVVGDARRVPILNRTVPASRWVVLSKSAKEPLPSPDYDLLASLESVGVPTIRSMIRGDRVLRNRNPIEALAYATLLARRLFVAFDESKPDVVLGSFDSAHSAMGLAVAKALGIPWVTMSFTVIPDNLTGFCRGMTPEQILPITRPVDDALREEARSLLVKVRSKNVRVLAYRPPESPAQKARQIVSYARSLARRIGSASSLGVDQFTFPTIKERVADVTRRSINGLRLPTDAMLSNPPGGRFIFFPLHMAPESSVDTWAPMYQNQLELAMQLSLAAPVDVDVVVKLHFSDPDNYSRGRLQQLMDVPRLRIVNPGASSSVFLDRATLVVGIAGTASLEAALLGKPVLLFGDSPYQHFPRTERAKRPDELYEQIQGMLNRTPPTEEEIVDAYAVYLARYMPGRINDWGRPIEDEEFARLADCFRALRDYVEAPGNRDAWYDLPPFVRNAKRLQQTG